jgi:hypothetical protein
MFKLDDTLDKIKELHSHSILNNDEYYTDKLLQVIIDLSTIDNHLLVNTKSEVNEDEIKKVKRKVPKWMTKTHQYNYQILKAYMDLSDNNLIPVKVVNLENYVDIGKVFLGHYNGMKTISEKNHGKVFNEIDRKVKLWEPVAEFIEGVFEENSMMSNNLLEVELAENNMEEKFRKYSLQTVEHETTVDGYVKSLIEDLPLKLNIDNILDIIDVNFLENLHHRCSAGGDLHEWNYAIGNGRPMSAIRKYIDFLISQK